MPSTPPPYESPEASTIVTARGNLLRLSCAACPWEDQFPTQVAGLHLLLSVADAHRVEAHRSW